MKKIILILFSLFIFSCDSGEDSNSQNSNCSGCPNNSLSSLIHVGESNNVVCDYSEISNLGCVNVVEAEVNEFDQTIIIYYNVDSNISGFLVVRDQLDGLGKFHLVQGKAPPIQKATC